MSRENQVALRRYEEIYHKRQAFGAEDSDGTAEFYRAAESCGASWYRIYLAERLSSRFLKDRQRGLARWLILHCAIQAGAGHLRTDLDAIEDEMPLWYLNEEGEAPGGHNRDLPGEIRKALDRMLKDGSAAGLIGCLETENTNADSIAPPRPPMLLSPDRRFLYFLRRRREEDTFLELLEKRTAGATAGTTPAAEFPLPSGSPNGSAAEILKILSRGPLVILSGGPGTGKTTTVAKLVELIDTGRRESGMPPLKAAFTAPTGRAAARLGSSLGSVLGGTTETAAGGRTLHSLLGIYPGRPPRHNRANPLPYALVVVDEASMVDLPLMNALLDAMSEESALLLVGDPGQLPSVEAGALLGDLLAGEEQGMESGFQGPLSGTVVRLKKTYRSNNTILNAAAAVSAGDLEALNRSSVSGTKAEGVSLRNLPPAEELARYFAGKYRKLRVLTSGEFPSNPNLIREKIDAVFELFSSFTALTPVRKGPYGVISLNQRISQLVGGSTSPFSGMPLMIGRNDESRNLWNGDRGVLMRLDGRLRAVFHETSESYRALPLAVLPEWEPAWLQTIHKSQGSEFGRVAILLPAKAGPLLSREILYTGITRARDSVELFADTEGLALALSRRVERHSRIRHWAAGWG